MTADILRWDTGAGALVNAKDVEVSNGIEYKARKFVKLGLVDHLSTTPEDEGRRVVESWRVRPLPRLSQTHYVSYSLTKLPNGRREERITCTCQRYRTKGLLCSHGMAVKHHKEAS